MPHSELTQTDRTVHTTAVDGSILDWLVSPAWSKSCEDLDSVLDPNGDAFAPEGRWVLTNGPDSSALKEKLYARHPIREARDLPAPAEDQSLSWDACGTVQEAAWRRRKTGVDGLVDWSEFCFTPEYREALAATVLEVDQAEWRTIEVRTTGPFVLWLNGEVVLTGARVSYMEPETHQVRVRLPSRTSTLHIASWQVAFRECRQVLGVRIVGLPVQVVIPSPGADEHTARLAEKVLAQVGSASWAQEDVSASVTAPAGVALKIRSGQQEPWQQVVADESGQARFSLLSADATTEATSMLAKRESLVEVGLDDPRCPQTVWLRLAKLPQDSTMISDGEPAQWREDVLRHVAGSDSAQRATGVAELLARFANDSSTRVEPQDVASALLRINTRGDCADFELLGLLLAWHRLPADNWSAGTRQSAREAFLGMKYWITHPGLDAMCYFTENHQFVWHVAQLLAGETFPDEEFSNDGRTGSEHAAEARGRAAGWMSRKLAGGFSEFDSNAYLAIDSLALVTLIELGGDAALTSAARTLLDKTLLSLATNSWRGVHGAAHGRSYVQTQRSARFEETSPILRLICGVGTLNSAVLPVTALATTQRYEIPEVVRELAGTEPARWSGRQVYRGKLAFERDLLERPYRSDLRVWRTPGAMLSSVQDYRSGLPGLQEHVWGATLSRELQVYVTHPANSDTGNSARPNGWVGHRILPRVHQHQDLVIHLQRFTDSDPLDFTHLWLPVAQAREWVREGDWITAATEQGYVAVATPGGVEPVRSGDTAWQEWIPQQRGAVWVATVGDASTHGSFAAWRQHLEQISLHWNPNGQQDPGVRVERPHEPELAVSSRTAFLIDGRPEGIGADGRPAAEPHLSNPAIQLGFDDSSAVAEWNGKTLSLDIAQAQTLLKGIRSDTR